MSFTNTRPRPRPRRKGGGCIALVEEVASQGPGTECLGNERGEGEGNGYPPSTKAENIGLCIPLPTPRWHMASQQPREEEEEEEQGQQALAHSFCPTTTFLPTLPQENVTKSGKI